MAKSAVVPTVKINHVTDTVLTLPNSKVTITINKNVSMKKIAAIDDYLVAEKTLPKLKLPTIQSAKPNLQNCKYEWDTVTFWESEFQYKPMPGKSLGITNDLNLITLQDAKNIYGFSFAAAQGFDNIATVFNAGFDYEHIMVDYLNPTSALAILQSTPNLYPKCSYYEIDEPTKNSFSTTDTKSLETLINNWNIGAKVMLTDYHWPEKTLCTDWYNWGQQLGNYEGSDYYIMCDNYGTPPDPCGDPCDFWNEYISYYNPAYVFSNWVMNQSAQSSNWDCCFKLANGSDQNINQIWLYAGTGDVTAIQLFVGYAWSDGWLLQFQKQKVNVLINTSNDCDPDGPWAINQTWYTGNTEWVGN
jgi:hypothetical protein